jgi:hypothetical protein
MNLTSLIQDLGEDAELILMSDKWLSQQEVFLSAELDRITAEYKSVIAAKKVKRILQNQNMIAVDRPTRLEIEIAKVPEVLKNMTGMGNGDVKTDSAISIIESLGMSRILPVMLDDGYDIIGSYLHQSNK